MVFTHKISLNSFSGSLSKDRKRVGRGIGSGKGRTCGAGNKGQSARSGTSMKRRHAHFARSLPKYGFTSNKPKICILTLETLLTKMENGTLSGSVISIESIAKAGIDVRNGLKVIGKAQLNAPITIKAHSFSKGAVESIKAAGGIAEVVSR